MKTESKDPERGARVRGFGYPKELRIRRRSEFDRVFEAGRRLSDSRMTLVYASNALGRPRLGIIAGRKLGSAAARNRAKRVIREAFRLLRPSLPSGFDLVVVPRPVRAGWSLDAARESLAALASRIAPGGANG